MSASDANIFETLVKVDNKDLYIDLKQNKFGVYAKISERSRTSRSTVVIPLAGITDVIKALKAAADVGAKVPASAIEARPEKKVREPTDPAQIARSVFVSDLSYDTTDESLAKHFRSAGTVVKASVLTGIRRGVVTSRGSGTVEFKTPTEAKRAVATLNDTVLDEREIKVREERPFEERPVKEREPRAEPVRREKKEREPREPREKKEREPRPPFDSTDRVLEPTKVFATALAWETTVESLTKAFSAVGRVVNAEILTNSRTGRSLGHGIVEFTNEADASEAIERLNGREVDGREIKTRAYYTK